MAINHHLQGPHTRPVRVLTIPGLRGSGPDHWQSWLETQYSDAVRVNQTDLDTPDLGRWSNAIAQTIRQHSPDTCWVAVAHSFGCLALANLVQQDGIRRPFVGRSVVSQIVSAVLVAPADPLKFDVVDQVTGQVLHMPSTLVASESDPWMAFAQARHWARNWGSQLVNLGDAGHINVDSGHGPWPLIRVKVDQLVRHQQVQNKRGSLQERPFDTPIFAVHQTTATHAYLTSKGTHHGQSSPGRHRP